MEELESLVMRAQSGDHTAFAVIVHRFQDMAVGYAYSILGDFALAEDASQEAFVQAYIDLKKLREPRAFSSWFRRVVYKYSNRISRGKRLWTVPIDEAKGVVSEDSCPLKHAESQELSNKVMQVIQSLPEQERVVTTLFYINGYSQAEVSEFLDVPVSTVKSRLYLARKKIQERLTDTMMRETLRKHAPGKDFTRKVEKVLEDIENIEWKKGCVCFCGSVVACMKYLREDLTYDFVAGVSGSAFSIMWHPEWSLNNCDPLVFGEEPVRHTFQALGYNYTMISHDFEKILYKSSEKVWRDHIMNSIDQGRPVIAFGIIGPPESCVIAGYEDDGKTLLGRSYFYEETKGYFRRSDWYKDCFGMILIHDKTGAPEKDRVIRDTVEWAVELARTPERKGRITGICAYDAWAQALEHDEYFPEGDIETLTFRCTVLFNDGFCFLSSTRQSASRFLKSISENSGKANQELKAAAQAYGEEAELHIQGLDLGATCRAPEEKRLRIADRQLRLKMSTIVRQAGAKHREAVEHLEKALLKL